jgi:surface polysaccharide O-acyltransferase-like enzyme
MIHSSAPFLKKPIGTEFMIGNIFDGISRLAVPLFLMVSGALLLHKEEEVSVFFKKRASKIILPFLAWSVIYYIYKFGIENFTITQFIKRFAENDIYYHLWYLYLLIIIYLLIPLLRKLVQNTPTSLILYYIVLSIALDNIVTTSSRFFDISPQLYINGFSVYISYFLMGYLVFQRKIFKDYKKHLYVAGLIAVFAIIIGTLLMTDYKGQFNNYFYRSESIFVFTYTTAMMVFILNRKDKILSFTKSVSQLSFTIYFVHLIFLEYYQKLLAQYELHAILMIPAVFIMTLITSFIFSWIVARIPIVRKVL